jgi:hypothetical protein
MSTQAELNYDVEPIALTAPAIAALMTAVPLTEGAVAEWLALGIGTPVKSDATAPVGVFEQRKIKVALEPLATAVGTAVLDNGCTTGSPVLSVTVVNPGEGYIQPPIVGFGGTPQLGHPAQARCFLHINNVDTILGGVGYTAPHVAFVGGFPPRGYFQSAVKNNVAGEPAARVPDPGPFNVVGVTITSPGKGYTAGTIVTISGGGPQGQSMGATGVPVIDPRTGAITGVIITDPGAGYIVFPVVSFFDPSGSGQGAEGQVVFQTGTPATAHAVVLAGVITGIILDTQGDGYITPPVVVITDPTGTGAVATVGSHMGVSRVDMLSGGQGYPLASPPPVTFTPLFKHTWPDGASDQKQAFVKLLSVALKRDVRTPVITLAPIIT